MSAKKSLNRVHVYINRNFVIRVKDIAKNQTVLASANTLNRFLEKDTVLKLYDKLLNADWDKHTFLYRKRLKIEIVSK